MIHILGGGPAGAAAAITARRESGEVALTEKSQFPRHKVCGEFLSPEIVPLLEKLGVWDEFQESAPGRIRRMILHFPRKEKQCKLPETAFGMSRYRFDQILMNAAVSAGARVSRDMSVPEAGPRVIAYGRKEALPRGGRLFGFKAHFSGPASDAVELFFFSRGYVGVNPADHGITNVCGIAPEAVLQENGFDMDAVVHSFAPLAARIAPLTRTMKWMTVGPLLFRNRLTVSASKDVYLAGDALSFVDPFTGSGILAAVATGRLAALAVARGLPVSEYLRECRRALRRPFEVSSIFRAALESGWAERLVPLVPGNMLFRWTRPGPDGSVLTYCDWLGT